MSEKKGFLASLFGKKEEKINVFLPRPEEETIRPLRDGEWGCPFCGALVDAAQERCPCCGRQQPWCLQEK